MFVQAKHLQFVSGVDAVSFWLATYSWDFINYLFPLLGIMIMFAAFQVDSLKNDLGAVFLLLVMTTPVSFGPGVQIVADGAKRLKWAEKRREGDRMSFSLFVHSLSTVYYFGLFPFISTPRTGCYN